MRSRAGWQHGRGYRFLVNLTGGTKLMSLAALHLFQGLDSQMLYVPIPRNECLEPYPRQGSAPPQPLTTRLTVPQYLAAYGFLVTNLGEAAGCQKTVLTRQDLSRFILDHYESLETILTWFGGKLRHLTKAEVRRGVDFAGSFAFENEAQRHLVDGLGFSRKEQEIRKTISLSDWEYLRGGWLEERLFVALRQALPGATDARLGLQVEDPGGNRNELDVAFTLENILYVVECKSLGKTSGGLGREREVEAYLQAHLGGWQGTSPL